MSGPNPNPQYITDAMWWLWNECETFIPGVRLGGIYAPKSGYHNTVNSNKKSWPGDYSIRLALDLTQPDNKARAIDLTMDNEQMKIITARLKASAEDPRDDRLTGLREFIGTLDGINVFCMIKDDEDGPWRVDWGRDSSHLWHEHLSIFTAFCALMAFMQALASVLSGQSYDDWLGNGGDDEMKCFYIKCDDGTLWLSNWSVVWQVGNWPGDEAVGHRQFRRDLPGSTVEGQDPEGFLCYKDAAGKIQRYIESRGNLTSGLYGVYVNPVSGGGTTDHKHSTPAGSTGGVVK